MGWIDRMDRWDGQTGRIDGMDGTVQLACNDAKGYGLRSDAMRKYALAHRHAPWDMHRRVGVNSKPRWQSVGAMSDYFGPIRAGYKSVSHCLGNLFHTVWGKPLRVALSVLRRGAIVTIAHTR